MLSTLGLGLSLGLGLRGLGLLKAPGYQRLLLLLLMPGRRRRRLLVLRHTLLLLRLCRQSLLLLFLRQLPPRPRAACTGGRRAGTKWINYNIPYPRTVLNINKISPPKATSPKFV